MVKQLIVFFSLAYLISWLIWWPLYAPLFGFSTYRPFRYQHALGALGPMLAGLYASYKFKGLKGFGHMILSSTIPNSLIVLSTALLSPFLIALLAVIIQYFQTGVLADLSKLGFSSEFPDSNIASFFFYNLVFFGLGEEIGWRGFVLPRLQSRYSALLSSVLLTVFWAFWHWPLFLYRPGYMNMDLFGVIGWLLSLLTGSILLTWLYNSSRGSILACAVFHSAMDVAFTSDYLGKNLVGLMGILITLWGIITILIFKPRNLSGMERVKNIEEY